MIRPPKFFRHFPVPVRRVLEPLYAAWMTFAHALGWVNGRIILTVLYIVIFGPYAIVRAIGRLASPRKTATTYWIEKRRDPPSIQNLRRMFS